jgi:phosphopantothenoylcysteine decarboxylase/phosphopantothenate--cysteine ligase
VVITAGPTREPIDPVRYLSNHSSGKMGFALARAAREAGATVTLIAGPVTLDTPESVERIDVHSAEQMRAEVMAKLATCDLFIAAAAVADYRPESTAPQKLKKQSTGEVMELRLVRNPDILAEVANHDSRPAMVVGFAAETENVVAQARSKLVRKGVDLIIANDVSRGDIGFNSEQNQVVVVSPTADEPLAQASKLHVAGILISRMAAQLPDRKGERQ